MKLRGMLGLGPSRREFESILEAEREKGLSIQRTFEEKIAHLEGMLDVLGDPDANLAGGENQAFYRAVHSDRKWDARDFTENKRLEALKLAHAAYAMRGDAHDILDTIIDFVFGDDGIWPKASDPKNARLQDRLDELWTGAPNDLVHRAIGMVLSYFIEGEQHYEAFLNPLDGSVSLGRLGTEIVDGVVQDQYCRDAFVVTKVGGALSERVYFVLTARDERTEINRLPAPEATGERWEISARVLGPDGEDRRVSRKVHGLVFSWFANRPDGATRGRQTLLPSLDYIDMHDGHLWNTAERERLLRSFLIDVTSDEITDKGKALEVLREMGLDRPPDGPTVLAHSTRRSVNVMQPNFSTGDFQQLERLLEVNIYGANGMPEHWRGDGAGGTKGAAFMQEAKPLRRMRRFQGDVVRNFTAMIQTMLDLQAVAGAGERVAPKDWKFQVTEIGGRDKQRGAEIFQAVASAATAAVSAGFLTREAANGVAVQILREAGFDVPDEVASVPDEMQGGLDALLKRFADGAGDGGSAAASARVPESSDEKAAGDDAPVDHMPAAEE